MLSLTNKKGGSRMKILNEVIKEKPDSKHICVAMVYSFNKKEGILIYWNPLKILGAIKK